MSKAMYAVWAILVILTSCQTTEPQPFTMDEGEEKQVTYSIEQDTVTFIFNEQFSRQALTAESVDIRGSFSSWNYSEDWEMQRDGNRWILQKPLAEVMIPGNLGVPEYKFVVNDSTWVGADRLYPHDYQLATNMLIVPETVSLDELDRKREMALNMRTEYDSDRQMANFRSLQAGDLGDNVLYRGYHPFIVSKTDHPRERDRVQAAARLMADEDIRAVINLSETEAQVARMDVFDHYQQLIDLNMVLFTETSYREAYWHSDSAEFAQTLNDVFTFIAEQPADSYYVHCRLGTDRTGIVIAVLAGFMDSSWPEILSDYLLSNEVGIREYRDPLLLQYSLENMLGIAVDDNSELKAVIDAFLLEQVGLNEAQLERAFVHLQG